MSGECGEVTWKVAYKHHAGYYEEDYRYHYYYEHDDEIGVGDYIMIDDEVSLDETITIPDLPHGYTWIKYIVIDECDNVNNETS